jgi:hypothetical protein
MSGITAWAVKTVDRAALARAVPAARRFKEKRADTAKRVHKIKA